MSHSNRRIPLVSLHDYTHGTAQEKERFVQIFGEGLREFGFVSVKDHGISDDLIRRIAEDAFGRGVPGNDRAIELLADDSVVGRFDDRGKQFRRIGAEVDDAQRPALAKA